MLEAPYHHPKGGCRSHQSLRIRRSDHRLPGARLSQLNANSKTHTSNSKAYGLLCF